MGGSEIIEEIKKKSLDFMRHNQYIRGRIEIDVDTQRNNCVVKIHQFEILSEGGRSKKLQITETYK